MTPLPDVGDPGEVAGGEVAGGEILPFPARLNAVPPRVASGSVPGVSVESYREDNRLWKKHVEAYKKINKYLVSGRYRNVMDMNAGLGGFAAAMESPKLWVMNVVPTIAKASSLAAVYERGLIGIYHDWYAPPPRPPPSCVGFLPGSSWVLNLDALLVWLQVRRLLHVPENVRSHSRRRRLQLVQEPVSLFFLRPFISMLTISPFFWRGS